MILVTGGAGYIGSHVCIELLTCGFSLVVLDNLSNSSTDSLERVCAIQNVELLSIGQSNRICPDIHSRVLFFVEGDVRDHGILRSLFSRCEIDAVVHFAVLKAVGDSVENPLAYYDNNVCGSVALIDVMGEFGCKRLVFSSSATVYGNPASVPIREDFPLSTTNPYGTTKLITENILRDVFNSDSEWSIALLRYFNPVGAHKSGLIGEDPNGVPNNLVPFISQVAIGVRDKLYVFGGDYETADGTGVRDYIHVVDLARGHAAALNRLLRTSGLVAVNLGAGRGYSVLEMIAAFEKVSGKKIAYEIVGRRPGDVAQCYSDPSYAEQLLGWKAQLGIEEMCADTWRWQKMNPKGYRNSEP